MNLKGLRILHLAVTLLGGSLFLSEASASSQEVWRLSRQISVEASDVYRTASDQARHYNQREDQALRDLRDVQDVARNLEMDASRPRQSQFRQTVQRLEQAVSQASRTIWDLSAYRSVERQFRNIEYNLRELKQIMNVRPGPAPRPTMNMTPMARQYKRQIKSVIQELKQRVVRRRNNGRGAAPRLRRAIQELRTLKLAAQSFVDVTKNARRPRRVKRAFEQLAAAHRMARGNTMQVLRNRGVAQGMREASRMLRAMGQRLQNRNNGGFNDDFGSWPIH